MVKLKKKNLHRCSFCSNAAAYCSSGMEPRTYACKNHVKELKEHESEDNGRENMSEANYEA